MPIGIVAFYLNWRLVPVLSTNEHTFDWIGVALSGVAMFALVFGLQDGEQRDWDAVIWLLIAGGILLFTAFGGGSRAPPRKRWSRCISSATATSQCPTSVSRPWVSRPSRWASP